MVPERPLKILNTHSEADQIILYLQGRTKAELSPKLKQKIERLFRCSDLIKTYGTKLKVCKMMENVYKVVDVDYSLQTAYRDFDDTQLVFGTMNKAGNLDFHLDILLGQIAETRELAFAKKDAKTMAACDKNKAALLEKHFGTKDAFPLEEIQPPIHILGFFPEQTGIKVPGNWEERAKELIKTKKRKSIDYEAEDAQIEGEEN